ncbi:hypothetical protein QQF64_035805 [Cirrhinus molitorella]|uniref:Uncharacterized protein n=1 Tax=Cirrhinus molitorella TaxID=172907 RepID=A0ABR3NGS5_9TELE
MVDFFIPANFKHVISAVRVISGFNKEKNSYRIPSLALKLGHSLNKICSIVESNAMMYEAKWNAPQITPFTLDVKVLHAHLEKKHNELLSKLRNCPSSKDSYAALAKVTLSQVILFNSCVCTSPEFRSVVNEEERFLCSSNYQWFLPWSCSLKHVSLVAFQLRIPLCLPDLEQCLPTEEKSASAELLTNLA